jgi:hypothetical protein
MAGLCYLASIAKSAEPPDATRPLQSQQRFEQAIRYTSTAPFFVLITVVDDRTGVARAVCTTANLFLGAIHREYGLSFDTASITKAIEIALASPDHVFHFSKREVLDHIASYSEEAIASARKTLDGWSEQRILATPYFFDPAMGCAITERGLSARMGDRAAVIFPQP